LPPATLAAKLKNGGRTAAQHKAFAIKPGMASQRTKQQLFDEEFLGLRARILEVAAGLDRIDRAEGPAASDSRRERLQRAIALLAAERPDRAAQVQMLFSREYDENWRQAFGV
jgi:hypothetical protein